MKVFICYRTGEDRPLHVFANKQLADIWLSGVLDAHGSGGIITEMEITGLPITVDLSIKENDRPSAELIDLYELEFSARIWNCLKNAEITTTKDLISKTPSWLLRMPNFGRKALKEMQEELNKKGLSLANEGGFQRKKPEEYETIYYKELVPTIKSLQKQGLNAQQIFSELKGRFINYPCVPTIQSIMTSLVYS